MWVLYVSCLLGYAQGIIWTEPVDTPVGKIRGQYNTVDGSRMYLGIPYGKVDQNNPFGASARYPKFDDTSIFDAIDDSLACPQREEFNNTVTGTLDCLRLNVHVPNTTESKLAVIVWIHGGHFTIGFSGRITSDPKYLVDKNVLVVTVSYRLGVYGFMCLDTPDVPGNAGLKDQFLAMKWINENIESFGGDPNKVTIMGESAGGMSVDFHLMSDQPKLYHQAILQSGSGLIADIIYPSDNKIPFRIAEHLGFITNDMQQALSFLASCHSDLVIKATNDLRLNFRVCIEKKFENVENIIPAHPHHVHKIDKVNNMTILAGFNSDERLLYFNRIGSLTDSFFTDEVAQDYNTEELQDMIEIVRRFYISDKPVKAELIRELIEMASDIKFNHPVQQSITKYLESGATNVYQYMFSYSGERNYFKIIHNVTEEGAAHADDLGYLFDAFILSDIPSADDQKVIDAMTTMWANFAKYGNPTPWISEEVPVIWTPASREMISYLNIDYNLSVVQGSHPYHARMSFWDLFRAANEDKLWANSNNTSSSHRLSLNYSMFVYLIFSLLVSLKLNM